eukprot:1160773-Pelagomonas_calceolata.AAC.5
MLIVLTHVGLAGQKHWEQPKQLPAYVHLSTHLFLKARLLITVDQEGVVQLMPTAKVSKKSLT